MQTLVSPQATLIKRELLRIPFWGWAFSMVRPIAIDRGNPRTALRQFIEQGKDRLGRGMYVTLFPEGTRLPAGGGRQVLSRWRGIGCRDRPAGGCGCPQCRPAVAARLQEDARHHPCRDVPAVQYGRHEIQRDQRDVRILAQGRHGSARACRAATRLSSPPPMHSFQ